LFQYKSDIEIVYPLTAAFVYVKMDKIVRHNQKITGELYGKTAE